jgi:hypothetical protein
MLLLHFTAALAFVGAAQAAKVNIPDNTTTVRDVTALDTASISHAELCDVGTHHFHLQLPKTDTF